MSSSGVLNTAKIDREVYLVKVPDVVASFIRTASAANGGKGVVISGPSAASSSSSSASSESSEKRPIGTLTEIGGPARPTFNAAASGAVSASTAAGAASSSSSAAPNPGGSLSGVGTKRTRSQMRWQLDPAVVEAVVGKEAAKRTPKTYTLNLDEPNGTRIIEMKKTTTAASSGAATTTAPSGSAPAGAGSSETAAAGSSSSTSAAAGSSSSSQPQQTVTSFSFFGTSSRLGTLVPDMRDPSYDAYTKHRRQQEKEATANKKSTTLAGGAGPLDIGPTELDFANRRAQQEAAAQALAAQRAAERAAAAMAAGALATATATAFFAFSGGRHASSPYELFERAAYWSIKEMCEATGKKEAELKASIAETCDYIRSGPHRGTYRLKPAFVTATSVKPDLNDGIGATGE